MPRKRQETEERAPDPTDLGPWKDRTNRFAVDHLLRSHGYRIARRPRRGPVLWEIGGHVITEDEALSRLDAADVADANYLEDLYRSGLRS